MLAYETIDLILAVGFIQSLFLAILLQILPKKNKEANYILALILLISSIMLLGRVYYFKTAYESRFFCRIATFADGFIYAFGPLLYMYYRRLTIAEKSKFTLPFFHFIPVILFLGYYFWTLTTTFDGFRVLYSSGKLYWIFFTIESIGIGSCLYYGYQCHLIVRQYKSYIKDTVSYPQQVASFLTTFLIAIASFLGLWIISWLNNFIFDDRIPFISYDWVWIAIIIVIYTIGYYSLIQPEIMRIPISSALKPPQQRLKEDVSRQVQQQLLKAMEKENLYRNPELTLVALSHHLHTSTNNVSWVLNTIFKQNFYDFVNEYRLQEFIAQVKAGAHQKKTLFAIALEVGFNSKTTFNKVFKAKMNTTPSHFVKSMKIEFAE